jgi:hypothetical protein
VVGQCGLRRSWKRPVAVGVGKQVDSNVGAGQMSVGFPVLGRARLTGRRSECEKLDRLIEGVRAGESRALVVRGEPGMGKTALLDYVADHASGCSVARAAGVPSEMELAFAGVHQLCAVLSYRLIDRNSAPSWNMTPNSVRTS